VAEVFVGRIKELAVAADLLQRARAGRPAPLLVSGPPGSGKTAFLRRVVDDARHLGFRTVLISADRVDADIPHAATRLALDPLLLDETDPSLLAPAAALREALAHRTPVTRDRLHALMARMLEGWAFRSPVLFGVDDLHHADRQSASTVIHLMRAARQQRAFIVATTRPAPAIAADIDAELEDLARANVLHTLAMGELDDDELARLIQERTARRPTTRLVQLLSDRSGGTPFFAIELLDAMARSDNLIATGDTVDVVEPDRLALPTRVSTAVLHRVFTLGPDARAVASAAAVLGAFPGEVAPMLAAVSGLPMERTVAAFEALRHGGVLVTDAAGVRFDHAIVRDAVYEDIGPAARQRIHRRAAESLAAAPNPDLLEVAHHTLHSTAGHDPAAARTLAAAGDVVADAAPRAATAWYRAAISRMPAHDPGVVAIQIALARVLDLSGDHADGMRVAEAALAAATDVETRRRALQRVSSGLMAVGRRADAVRLLDTALADPAMRAPSLLLQLAQSLLWSERWSEVPGLVEEARQGAAERHRPIIDAVTMHAALAAGRFSEGIARWRSLSAGLDDLPPSTQIPIRVSLCAASALNFDPADALLLAQDGADDTPRGRWMASIASIARYRAGRFDEIEEWAATARDDLEHADGRLSTGLWLATMIAARVERADPSAAEFAAIAERAPRVPIAKTAVDVARAMWHRVSGDHAAAATLVERAVERERRRGQVNFLAMALAASVTAAVERDDQDAARRDNDALQALADADSVAVTMYCLHARAVVDRDVEAATAALEHAQRHGLGADAGRALGLLGALTADAGALGDSYRELGRLGAVWRQRVVAHDLRRLGHRVPHAPPSAAELSPVEVEVVSLVTAGLTNRQIAERMGLSPKTVEVYLSRIYVKTGHRSRVELAVARLGPPPGA
jgi:DNA-binding CsgD family transcriptional regulator